MRSIRGPYEYCLRTLVPGYPASTTTREAMSVAHPGSEAMLNLPSAGVAPALEPSLPHLSSGLPRRSRPRGQLDLRDSSVLAPSPKSPVELAQVVAELIEIRERRATRQAQRAVAPRQSRAATAPPQR